MNHPLESIPATYRKALFTAFLAGALILAAVLRVLDAPLQTPAAPNGIVSFELARTPEKAFQIMVSWEPDHYQGPAFRELRGYLSAAFSLGLDYLFMPLYASALSLGLLLAAGKHKGRVHSIGAWLGWGAYVAALFDAVENFALWKILTGEVFSAWPAVAFVCAALKFGLLALGVVIALVAWLQPKKA